MSIFWNIYIKSIAIFVSILTIIIFIILLLSFFQDKNNKYSTMYGDESSSNIIAVYELNGLIIETSRELANFIDPFIISPFNTNKNLENLKEISPKVIIFSINSPGGTVSASKKIYDIIKNYKKDNNIKILVHTNELLASGGYWVATAADEIYASYGSIIGSIGVKGPDWFFYDKPKKISTGIFGNSVETENGIKLFSNTAGKSKDLFNPFRQPSKNEIKHLQNMVDTIYNDFIRIISKERKIETSTLINDIGAQIYTSKKAYDLHLIDDELNLDALIKKTSKSMNLQDYKVVKITNPKNSLIRELFNNKFYKTNKNIYHECLNLRSSMAVVLNYEATGC